MRVLAVQPWECDEWFLKKHYARRMPQIVHAFGLYDGGMLRGVVSYGIPASLFLCKGICGEEHASRVLELNRLVVDHEDRNAASFLIASSLRLLPRPAIVVSYADTKMGHVGYVYQATNWLYTGLSAKRTDPKASMDTNTHSRHVWSKRGQNNDNPEWELVQRSRKHRYVYFLGTKKEKREMRNSLRYPIESYPKGETARYDDSHVPKSQMTMF